MSFDVGPIKQPLIQKSQQMLNDGGGGNLGYMQRGKKKKEEETSEENLLDKDEVDILQLNSDEDSEFVEEQGDFSPSKWLGNIVDKIAEKVVKKPDNPFHSTNSF